MMNSTTTTTTIDTNNSSTTAPVVVGLCASRHAMPVKSYIYPESVDPTDFDGMEKVAEEFILHHVGLTVTERQALDQRYGEDVPAGLANAL